MHVKKALSSLCRTCSTGQLHTLVCEKVITSKYETELIAFASLHCNKRGQQTRGARDLMLQKGRSKQTENLLAFK